MISKRGESYLELNSFSQGLKSCSLDRKIEGKISVVLKVR